MIRPAEEIARDLIEAATTWEPGARIVSNVTAEELRVLAESLLFWQERFDARYRQWDDLRCENQRLRDNKPENGDDHGEG